MKLVTASMESMAYSMTVAHCIQVLVYVQFLRMD